MELLKFILEEAPAYLVQDAVKEFNIPGLIYKFRRSIENEFPEFKGHALKNCSYVLEEFKTDQIFLKDLNHRIIDIQNKLRILGKWHPDYRNLCFEHDAMVTINNKLNEPISKFLKLYKKAQKEKGRKLSIVKKKERYIAKPVE